MGRYAIEAGDESKNSCKCSLFAGIFMFAGFISGPNWKTALLMKKGHRLNVSRMQAAESLVAGIPKLRATPHNSAVALTAAFPPSLSCINLDLPPVNLRFFAVKPDEKSSRHHTASFVRCCLRGGSSASTWALDHHTEQFLRRTSGPDRLPPLPAWAH